MLIAAADLTAAAHELDANHGLGSIEGGRHPGWGTANRIVPLGDAYLELITVVDAAEAAQSSFGRWVAEAAAGATTPLGWCVRTRRLDEVAGRLGLAVTDGSRVTRAGHVLRWRLAGLDDAAREPSLPFFIEWEQGTPHPGRIPGSLRTSSTALVELQLDGDADRLATWLGGRDLPVNVRPGTPSMRGIVLRGAEGDFTLGG